MAKKTTTPLEEEEIYKVDNVTPPNTVSAGQTFLFKSIHINTILFQDPDHYIKFNNRLFSTDDQEIADFIRKHPAFGQEIFENEYPEWVLDKFKREKEYIRIINPEEDLY